VILKIEEQTKTYDEPKTLLEIARESTREDALAATVNGRLRELTFSIDKDSTITFLNATNSDAIRIYESTLRYVIAMALHRLYPQAKVQFNYSISRSILAVVEGLDGSLNARIIEKIKEEVNRIIAADFKIERKRVPLAEAIELYQSFNMPDKVAILKYRKEDYVNLYQCENYINYMFGYMLPSTGFLTSFRMFLYHPGFIIQYPRAEFGGSIPDFSDEPTFGKTLKEADHLRKLDSFDESLRENENLRR